VKILKERAELEIEGCGVHDDQAQRGVAGGERI
jgi:hypothetical protein